MPTDLKSRSRLVAAMRSELFDMLGRECVICGSTSQLEINHIYRREWTPRKVGFYERHLRYRREAAMGLLNILCKTCNGEYRPMPMAQALEAASASDPFLKI